MTVKVSEANRRARLLSRHRLSDPAATVAAATDAMVALHATDPVTVYLSARARVPSATAESVDDALYAERGIVRMLGMRRTVFVVPAALLRVVQRACTDDVARRLRRQLERDLANGGIGDGDAAAWLRNLGDSALRALAARGSATGAQLSAAEPLLRTQLVYVPDKSYGGPANITSRVLGLLAAEGHMIRGHRRGGWSSGQFEWSPPAAWLAGGTAGHGGHSRGTTDKGKPGSGTTGNREPGPGTTDKSKPGSGTTGSGEPGPGTAGDGNHGPGAGGASGSGTAGGSDPAARGGSSGPRGDGPDAAAARAELARRWLWTFGPAPVGDLQWWAGWTGAQTKAALTALPVCEADLDGQPGIMLDGDDAFDAEPAEVAALLPALDPTPMGWQARGWFLGPHATALFDRTGNIGPTVWWKGRIVGGWAQGASGEVVVRLLEDIGADAAAAVAAEAVRLEAWLGSARVTPRFRTPLERQLSA